MRAVAAQRARAQPILTPASRLARALAVSSHRATRTSDELAAAHQQLQKMRTEYEQAQALLGRYRAEAEDHHHAIQAARDRLKQMNAAYDERIEQVREEEAARYRHQLEKVGVRVTPLSAGIDAADPGLA